MQKSKIKLLATIAASVVGLINSAGAVLAYSMIVPEPVANQTLIASGSGAGPVIALPTPAQQTPSDTSISTVTVNQPTSAQTSTGGVVTFREQDDRLTPGQAPSPAAITTTPTGETAFKWCSGTNPNLPNEVCEAIVSIIANPVESNPHLGPKARQSLSLLPAGTSISMDESSWTANSSDSGTMLINASTTAYGKVRIKIVMQKQNNIWVLTDGQLA